MVFVPVHRSRPEIEPTREEAALVRELQGKGVPAGDLEGALAARGVDPGRAQALAKLARPRTATDRAQGLAGAVFWVGIAVFFGAGKRPLQRWLHEHHPGSEWLVELVIPVLFGLAVLWTLMNRLRAAGDAPQGTTRADEIENKPIG